MSKTHDYTCFTISEVAADWNELMIPQRTTWPPIAHISEQLDPWCSQQTYHHHNQPLGLHPVVPKLLIISYPAEGRRLNWSTGTRFYQTTHSEIQRVYMQMTNGEILTVIWKLQIPYSNNKTICTYHRLRGSAALL